MPLPTSARQAAGSRWLLGGLVALQLALAIFAVAGKEAVATIPPLTLEGARRAIAGLILLGLVGASGARLRPTRSDLLDAIIPGVIGFGIGRGCVMIALSLTSATNVALIDSSAPAVALALSVLFGGQRPRRLAVAASGAAFAGVASLVLGRGLTGAPNIGDVIALGSPICWGAIYVWLGRRTPAPETRARRVAWFSLGGAGALAVPAVAAGPSAISLLADPRVIWVLALGVVIGVLENGLTFRGIEVLGAVRTAELEYLVPVLAAVSGVVLLGIPVLGSQLVAMAVVIGALVVGGRARREPGQQGVLPGQPCCVT